MATIQLGFKAFDPHELLCHFIAAKAGLYERAGLQIELTDITFIADADLPRQTFQVSCGSALISAIKGIPQKVVFVATEQPMFWLYSINNFKSVQDLRDQKVATYPAIAPPGHFANIILKNTGLEPGKDLTCIPARDDIARLGLLRSGAVSAAVISSSIPPEKIKQLGFNLLCFFGDKIKIPTTGLAVNPSQLEQQPELVSTLANVLKQAIALAHEDPVIVATVLQEVFDVSADFLDATVELMQHCLTEKGQTTAQVAQEAIDLMGETLGLSPGLGWDQVYDFSLLDN